MADDFTPVMVSRRIGAPASAVFAILADPVKHLGFDGSGMLRGAITTAKITGATGGATSSRPTAPRPPS